VPDILLGMLVASLYVPLGSNPAWQLAPLENSLVFLRTSLALTKFIFFAYNQNNFFFLKTIFKITKISSVFQSITVFY